MSKTNPYAAHTKPEPTVQEQEQETPVEEYPATESAPESEPANDEAEIEVPEGSINEVLNWVDGDEAKAKAALEAEKNGENRKTLIKKLEELI